MHSQCFPGPESFLTEIAGERDALQMVSFYVVSDPNPLPFLSTDLANVHLVELLSNQYLPLNLLHH